MISLPTNSIRSGGVSVSRYGGLLFGTQQKQRDDQRDQREGKRQWDQH